MKFVTAAEFAAVREPSAEPLLGDENTNALPAGALALAYGDGGAGKTTLLLDMVVHLTAGRRWLGLEVPRPCKVVWIENEGPRGPLRLKVDAKLAAWGEPLDDRLMILEEPWAGFTFANELARQQLAESLASTDVLVIGPVQTLGIEGGGTPQQVQDFVALIDDVRARMDRPLCVILVHHENAAGQTAGAWRRPPDTLMHVTAQGHGKTRLFWQKARWASDLHGTTWHLLWRDGESFELETKPEVTEDTIADEILEAVRANPGGSWRTIRDAVTGSTSDCARVRDRLLTAGRIVNHATRQGYFNLWHPDDPADTGSETRTALEPLQFPPAGGGDGRSGSAVPLYRGNRNGNRTAHEPADTDNVWTLP